MVNPTLSYDPEANAGYISFSSEKSVAKTVPVYDDGEVIATMDFDAAGALIGVELLDAATQMSGLIPSK